MQPGRLIDSHRSLSKRAPASFSLLALFLVVGPAAFAACGDDGSVVGSDGSSGQASGGSAGSTSSAGTGQAGTLASAGASSGGATSTGGTTGTGGASCETSPCLRANVCLDKCGGKVLYSGCCECGPNTVEELSCMASGGQGSGGQASTSCVGTTCTAGQTCVAYRTVGGAVEPPSAGGTCMAGKHLEGNLCQADFGYTCAELTGCSAPAATCRCAASTKCFGTTVCKLPSDAAWLDSSADLVCELLAP